MGVGEEGDRAEMGTWKRKDHEHGMVINDVPD